MKAHYYCKQCDIQFDYHYRIMEKPPKELKCPQCQALASRQLEPVSVVVPDYMKAGEEGDAYTKTKTQFIHSKTPTGKDKIYY